MQIWDGCGSIEVFFEFLGFVQKSFQLNDDFHVHFIDFNKGVLVTFQNDALVFFFWVVDDFVAWGISFVLNLSDLFKFFYVSGELDEPLGRFRKSRRKRLLKLNKLSLLLLLIHFFQS